VENHAPTGIRFPDRPTRSESLYRLSCSSILVNISVREILVVMLLTYDLPTSENMQVECGGEFEARYLCSGVTGYLMT
jgi:hypothetical protein